MLYDLRLKHRTGVVTVKRCNTADPTRAIERALDALGTAEAFAQAVTEEFGANHA